MPMYAVYKTAGPRYCVDDRARSTGEPTALEVTKLFDNDNDFIGMAANRLD